MTRTASLVNALSFDIEDWFHILGIEGIDDPSTWDRLPSIVTRYTEEILRLLEQKKVRATFFVLGWIAERHPEQLPGKYGCSSWRQVVHESRLFELRYRDVDGRRAAWYRPKDA